VNIETLKLPVSELVLGMHVVRLDRPWLETPFKIQGFKIRTPQEIRQLARHCKFVYIDVERGVLPPRGKGERVVLSEDGEAVAANTFIPVSSSGGRDRNARAQAQLAAQTALPPPAVEYPLTASFAEELPRARAALLGAEQTMRDFIDGVRHGGRTDVEAVKEAASGLEQSLLNHPDPLLLLRALGGNERFSRRHCVHSAILAVALGRELGLKRQLVHELAVGMLLADIGKLRLPQSLLRAQRRLDRHEAEVIERHVEHGVELARGLGGLSPGTIDLIASHHERFDGSGYPRGLRGGEIPLIGRIAGLADSFDAITSTRTYAAGVPVHEAMQELYAAPTESFQRELVGKLFQALGTYPVGSVVALSDGSVALVLAQNRGRRLLPFVLKLARTTSGGVAAVEALDLATAGGLSVREVIDPASHGLPQPGAALLGG